MLDKSPKQYNKNQKSMSIYVGDEEGWWCQVCDLLLVNEYCLGATMHDQKVKSNRGYFINRFLCVGMSCGPTIMSMIEEGIMDFYTINR